MITGPAPSTLDGYRRSRSRSSLLAAVCAVVVGFGLVAGACSSDDTGSSSTTSTTTTSTAPAVSGAITVSAAASLKESFTTIAADFKSANPDAQVTVNFGSSGDLATQIESGAPVDVAAFAAESNMVTLDEADLLDGGYEIFATNELVIVTKPGNPENIDGLASLATAAEAGATIALCAETAPCGKYAAEVLSNAAVTIPADRVTRGQDVRATLAAVTDGDAAAAIVYVTDAKTAGDAVESVEIPTEDNAVAKYPIAVVKATTNAEVAAAFKEFVLGPTAQRVLQESGFGAP